MLDLKAVETIRYSNPILSKQNIGILLSAKIYLHTVKLNQALKNGKQ